MLLCRKHYKNFFSLLNRKIEDTQKDILLDILDRNKKVEYLSKYDIEKILSQKNKVNILKDFQNNIPIVEYNDIEKWIEKEKNGEKNSLLADDIKLFELTSGSTSNIKYIPYTKKFLAKYTSAIYVWLYDLYKNNKELYKGSVYWSISPILKRERFTKAGIRVGIEDDVSYFNKFSAYILDNLFTVPKEIKNMENMEDFLLITSIFLLFSKNLSMISIWSPSFLLILLDYIEANKREICEIIKENYLKDNNFKDKEIKNKAYFTVIQKKYRKLWEKNRAKYLIEKFSCNEEINYENIWEKLELISCWADGNSINIYEQLKKKFLNVKFQAKGLMSTECIVSFPLSEITKGSIVAYNSFFYEFIEINENELEDFSKIKLLNELEIGKKYNIIVTTDAGLYRYNTNDLIEVVAFFKNVPVINFIGRNKKYSDIVGEKLELSFVKKQISEFLIKNKLEENFALLAPVKRKDFDNKEKIFYTLFLDLKKEKIIDKRDIEHLEDDFNAYLCKAYHYNYAYELKQIEKSKIFFIESETGIKTYIEEKSKKQKIGDIKLQSLDSNFGWEYIFKGGYLE